MTWRPTKLTREQMEDRRREGFKLLKAGRLSQAVIARQLEVSEAAVSQWRKTLNDKGVPGTKARKANGRPTKLTAEERKTLRRILKRGAQAAGFPTERWTQARIQQVIQREWGVTYHSNYIGRLMASLGWSVQKPEPRPIERDEDLIRAWLSQDWRRIKKSAADRGRNRL